jgi:hypothetical protein
MITRRTRRLISVAVGAGLVAAALAGTAQAQIVPYPYEERPFGVPNVSEFDPNPPAGRGEVRITRSREDEGSGALAGDDVDDASPADRAAIDEGQSAPRASGVPNVSEFDPNPPARLEDLRAVQNPPRESRSGPRRMHYSSSAQEPDV